MVSAKAIGRHTNKRGPHAPTPAKSLSDKAVRSAKPKVKPYKLADGRSLYLLVNPAPAGSKVGSKLWRFSYRFEGKQKTLALGAYPDVSLALARERRDEAGKRVAVGIDPSADRKAERQAEGAEFEAVAREWLALKTVFASLLYVAGSNLFTSHD